MDKSVAFILSLFFVYLSTYMWQLRRFPGDVDIILDNVDTPDILVEQSKEFDKPEVIQVTEGVYVAIGFALANSIMLEGTDGLVIVDTTESEEAAKEILQHFRNISSKPIKAIVYTHYHADHNRGVQSFIEDPGNLPAIIGHELLPKMMKVDSTTYPKVYRGAVAQFGLFMADNKKAHVNCGIGPKINMRVGEVHNALPVTHFVRGDRQNIKIAGLELVFLHMAGETPDHLVVWMPDKKVLMAGDNIYKSFPNLYAIRGTPPRDVMLWANTVHKMRELNAHFLVPSHTQPVVGKQEIYELMTAYGNAIEYVHDQAVRCMNMYMHPDEAAVAIKLPAELASHPYLQEFYGAVAWSVKSVYTQYIGWFSGDPVELNPLPPLDRSKRMVQLVGVSELLDSAKAALKSHDIQWALELASYVFKARPSNTEARATRLEALQKLASQQVSANGRHFYLSSALADHGRLKYSINVEPFVNVSSIGKILNAMKTKLRAEDVAGIKYILAFNYTDTGEKFILKLENSLLRVLEVNDLPDKADSIIETTTEMWKSIILKKINAFSAYMSGELVVHGSLLELRKFMTYFDASSLKVE